LGFFKSKERQWATKMYLSVQSCISLDEIVKDFEVAYRSFVVDILIQKFPDEASFELAVDELSKNYVPSSVIYTAKYAEKLKQIKRRYQEHYDTIQHCYTSLQSKNFSDSNVPYVSEVVDYVAIFNNYFQSRCLLKNFASVEEFQYLSKAYLSTRNALSHPASSKVLIKQAQEVLVFINKLLLFLDTKYFWYVSSTDIERLIEQFQRKLTREPIKLHNLREIGFHQRKIVCRDIELTKLYNSIVGEAGYYRVAGSIVVFGYGGVGKTALVIEFLYDLLRHLQDNPGFHPIDFILFFTSKDELLKHSETTGTFYIDKIRQQITSFDEFESRFLEYLGINSIDDVTKQYKGGIVVIDNLENFDDKPKLFEFIKRSPRQIQYIITSREEEPCDDKLHIKEFKEQASGISFIRQYINENELEVALSEDECARLVKASRGNALILVLSLKTLHDHSNTVSGIISDLEYIKARDVEVIADFMYKNTFEKSLSDLEKAGYSAREVMTILSLYGEPIDLYSVSKLAQIDIEAAEYICKFLSGKLVLDKIAEFYSVNEFANNFIFIKLLPNELETKKISIKIIEHKQRVTEQRARLEQQKVKHSQVARIMQDWKPRNYVDELALAEAFNLYQKLRTATEQKDILFAEKLIDELHENEIVTSHPYVKFQKARAYTEILPLYSSDKRDATIAAISRSYEDAIQEIEFSYPYIKGTESHGAILWLYGTFLSLKKRDYPRSIRYLEQARSILADCKSKNYFLVLNRLAANYKYMYQDTHDRAYKHKLQGAIDDVKKDVPQARKAGFNVEKFFDEFEKRGQLD
jgi:GTPase SAR1 family protein